MSGPKKKSQEKFEEEIIDIKVWYASCHFSQAQTEV